MYYVMSSFSIFFFYNFRGEEFHINFRNVMPGGHEKDFVGFHIEYFSEGRIYQFLVLGTGLI